MKKCRNHLFYLADLYSKFNEIQKRLQGKDVTINQAQTLLIGFQANIGLFKSFLARRDFKNWKKEQMFQTGTWKYTSITWKN
ncbi:hypothetical protein T09_3043 [Trichinella sp. T9]|nr:hypothetical protein T09_3043 [Trichinella sp. T9]